MLSWNLFKSPKISDVAPTVSIAEARKRARILVIDDDPKAFPVSLLKAEGYNIEYWDTVKNFRDLETGEYDLIVLDIQGIASKEQSETDGIGILEHIKHYNPAQIVIAYSAKKYDLKQGNFWRLADDFLGKPSPLTECKQRVDELLRSRFSAQYYWGVLKDMLLKQDVPQKSIQKLEKLIVKRSKEREKLSKGEIADVIKLSNESLSAVVTVSGLIVKWITHA